MKRVPNPKVSRYLKKLAERLGFFVARCRPNHVYVDRARFRDAVLPVIPINSTNEAFYRIARDVINDGRTLLRFERLFVIWQAIRNVAHLKLPAAEVGSYRGGSSYFIANAFKTCCADEVPIHVIDTFEGHPASEIDGDIDTYHKPGMFTETSFEEVRDYLSEFKNVTVHKMRFSGTTDELPELTYSFVHIDVDVYITSKQCLDYFIPRLTPGGVMVIDDYEAGKCPGVKRAIEDIEGEYPGLYTWHMQTEQMVLVKKS